MCVSIQLMQIVFAFSQLKSTLIGSNKQKHLVIRQGIVPRLLTLLQDPTAPLLLKVHVAYTLGSLAKGSDEHRKELIDHGILPVILSTLVQPDAGSNVKLVEACLCCLKSIVQHPEAPIDILYSDDAFVPHLITVMSGPNAVNQIAVAIIFTHACKTAKHQNTLADINVISNLNLLVCSGNENVQLPALQCLACLVCNNEDVALQVSQSCYNRRHLVNDIVALMERNRRTETQLAAAKCLTYMCRCGILEDRHPTILFKVLPCVVSS
jgi:hypothetical protein